MLIRRIAACVLFIFATSGGAEDARLSDAWPPTAKAAIGEIGRGVAVVFSPDLSVPYNCRFYTALGFACFDDVDWTRVLAGIAEYSARHPEQRIRTVVLETHGTNGHGLKLQKNYEANADRSYISVAALQERLEPAGVRYVIISACNAGRLLRPSIYRTLNPDPGDRLFLPPTLGIIGATPGWDSARSTVSILTRASSHIEMTVVGSMSELGPAARKALGAAASAAGIKLPREFAISDLMMQMIARDSSLQLAHAEATEEVSRTRTTAAASERLFAAFLSQLDGAAANKR